MATKQQQTYGSVSYLILVFSHVLIRMTCVIFALTTVWVLLATTELSLYPDISTHRRTHCAIALNLSLFLSLTLDSDGSSHQAIQNLLKSAPMLTVANGTAAKRTAPLTRTLCVVLIEVPCLPLSSDFSLCSATPIRATCYGV